jgi:hypothetical protein
MALPATDTFTTGSDATLTAYSSNWTITAGGFNVTAADDVCRSTSGGAENGAYWNADTFSADQYAQAKVWLDAGTGVSMGVAVRATGSGNYYGVYLDQTTYYLFRMDAGSWTQLATGTATGFVDGDTLRLEVTGSSPVSLVMKRNGTQFGSTYNDSDANRKTSGSAGVSGYGNNSGSGAYVDDWEGGDIGEAKQIAAPTSDISAGNWVRSSDNAGTGLYTMLDETTYDDNDYVYVNSDSTLEVKFASVSDPAVSTGHKVRYRIKGNGAATITVSLRQGSGTEIASWAHTAASTTTTSYEQTLSSGQADSITDYADLRLRFVTFTP